MSAVCLNVPDDAPRFDLTRADLPDDITSEETVRRCRDIGDRWLSEGVFLFLSAPSLIVPQECNIMINPAHPLMERVTIISNEPFRFDERLAELA
jgi:RES domain-containing protein